MTLDELDKLIEPTIRASAKRMAEEALHPGPLVREMNRYLAKRTLETWEQIARDYRHGR